MMSGSDAVERVCVCVAAVLSDFWFGVCPVDVVVEYAALDAEVRCECGCRCAWSAVGVALWSCSV